MKPAAGRLAFLLGCLYFAASNPAFATRYFVNVNFGSDTNTAAQAQAAGTPWRTIGHSLGVAASGDTVNVASGIYTESVTLATSVTLLGPNAGKAWDDPSRGPEATLRSTNSDENSGTLFNLQASAVTVDGFLLDGDNPNATNGVNVNGFDVNTASAVTNVNGAWFNHFTFDNNVVRNFKYYGIVLGMTNSTASAWNYCRHNLFTNIWNTALYFYPLTCVDVESNAFRTVRRGIFTSDEFTPNPVGFSSRIAHNTILLAPTGITAFYEGIWVNHHWAAASPYEISWNRVVAAPSLTNAFDGILITSMESGTSLIASNNTIDGAGLGCYGYYVWNTGTLDQTRIIGGTVTGMTNSGIRFTSYDDLLGFGASYNGLTVAVVDRVVFSNNVVSVRFDTASPAIRSCLIEGGATGIVVNGGNAVVESCTVAANTGSGLAYLSGSPTNRNCIFWDNGADLAGSLTPDMIGYCDLEHGQFNLTNGCISVDPLFKGGNYRIAQSSPCANSGTNQAWMASAADLDGQPRLAAGQADRGAYETPGTADRCLLFIQ